MTHLRPLRWPSLVIVLTISLGLSIAAVLPLMSGLLYTMGAYSLVWAICMIAQGYGTKRRRTLNPELIGTEGQTAPLFVLTAKAQTLYTLPPGIDLAPREGEGTFYLRVLRTGHYLRCDEVHMHDTYIFVKPSAL